MQDLMTSNVFEWKNPLIISGTCLPRMDEKAFEKVKKLSENIAFLCLENTHMNMAAHKIASIVETGNVKDFIFISVDKSPHCMQLHHIGRELKKILKRDDLTFTSYVANQGELIQISDEVISLSKNFAKLSEKMKKGA